jgi:transcriptional regulator GlxA family with amidase domain
MLHETPADNATLADLGRRIEASTGTLSRLFRDELRMTF